MIKRKIITRKYKKNKKGGQQTTRRTQRTRSQHKTPMVKTPTSKRTPMVQRTSRTLKSTPKILSYVPETIKPKFSKDAWEHELSGKIQWLIHIAGAENVMEAIGDHFGNNVTIVEGKVVEPAGSYKNTLYFKTKFPKPFATDEQLKYRAGHWLYYDKKGNIWNSYELGHQVKNTNQFCQTFALMYMVNDNRSKGANYPKWVDLLKKYDYGHNICVAVDFWKYIFHYNHLTNWLIDVVKGNNDVTIEYNKDEVEINKEVLISNTTQDIKIQLIDKKLDDICKNADEIAIKTN
jgi:hypothetical protein